MFTNRPNGRHPRDAEKAPTISHEINLEVNERRNNWTNAILIAVNIKLVIAV